MKCGAAPANTTRLAVLRGGPVNGACTDVSCLTANFDAGGHSPALLCWHARPRGCPISTCKVPLRRPDMGYIADEDKKQERRHTAGTSPRRSNLCPPTGRSRVIPKAALSAPKMQAVDLLYCLCGLSTCIQHRSAQTGRPRQQAAQDVCAETACGRFDMATLPLKGPSTDTAAGPLTGGAGGMA
jgi:hypothetical protein